ncbi:MAG: riboflavin synthase [Xanthomonadales bacterium]|nr:riboflavin synthase [Xanthomonadales bacterium]
MFTGLIQHIGTIKRADRVGGDLRLQIDAGEDYLQGVESGASIAVSGPCLTAVDITRGHFSADVSVETLDKTTLAAWRAGRRVNLEKSLRPDSPLGGHFVTGHVDGPGRLVSRRRDARSERMRFEVPESIEALVAEKGSIAIEGVSLTINAVAGRCVDVNIVPHTLEATTLGELRPGDRVNIEADLLARYVARLHAVE